MTKVFSALIAVVITLGLVLSQTIACAAGSSIGQVVYTSQENSSQTSEYRDLNTEAAQQEIEYCTMLIEANASNAGAYVKRGDIYYDIAEYDKAIMDYTKAIELMPEVVYGYYARAQAYEKAGQIENALQDLGYALELSPSSANIYYRRGLIYANRLGENERAIEDFFKSLDLEPENVQYMNSLTYALLANGDTGDALLVINEGLKRQPNNFSILDTRGEVYEAMGRYEEALADYTRAKELLALEAEPEQRLEIEQHIARVKGKM